MEKTYKLRKSIIKTNGSKVILRDTLKDIDVSISDINYKFIFNDDKIEIILNSNLKSEKELEKEFFQLYDYIYILYGFYPKIISGISFNTNELAEKFNTGERYIITQENFLDKLLNTDFIDSFTSFKKLYNKIKFPIDYLGLAMSKINEYYCEITIVNLLQIIDGLYDCLNKTKMNRNIDKKGKINILKRRIRGIQLDDLYENELKKTKIKKAIEDSICRLGKLNYTDKLRFIFNDVDNKYEIFKLEKAQTDATINFDSLIEKCKHTRNKFSHSFENNKSFNGVECAFYIYKLILSIRLMIIEDIGLERKLNKNCIDYLVNITNKRLVEEQILNKEE